MSENKVQIQITAEDLASAVVAGISTAFAQMKNDLQKIAPSAKQAGDAINDAFSTLGIKSAKQLKAEQDKIIASFNLLRQSGSLSATEISSAHSAMLTELKKIKPMLEQTGNAGTQSFSGMLPPLKSLPLLFNQTLTMVTTLARALMSLAEPALVFEKIETRLKSATGSAQNAAIALTFVKDTSLKLGLDVESTADAFSKLAIATKNTSVEGKATRDMFEGFMTAFAALKLSGDETSRIFAQISQGFNKGKLELEDLKIIAEAGIPIFDLLAGSMGKSKPEIMKMISDGRLLANEVYPKVAEAAKKAFGEEAEKAAKGTAGSIQNLKNELKLAKAALGDDLMPIVNIGIKGLHALTVGASGLVEVKIGRASCRERV